MEHSEEIMDNKTRITEGYKSWVLEKGRKPETVHAFAKSLDMKEADFYDYFGSFTAIEQSIWQQFYDAVQNKLKQDQTYAGYGAREKLLAFYYTLIEELKHNRSFIKSTLAMHGLAGLSGYGALHSFKKSFKHYATEISEEAMANEEIKSRMFIQPKQYAAGFWTQLLFVLNFWLKDHSKSFEKTDAAIEKAVSLSFEVLSHNPIDTAIDFARFMFQEKKARHTS